MYERDTDRSKYVSKELMRFYFDNKPITLENAINRAYVSELDKFRMMVIQNFLGWKSNFIQLC